MKSFADSLGRKWDTSFSLANNKRVRSKLGINLISLVQDNGSKGYAELLADAEKFVEVLFWVIEPQAREKGIDEYGFCDGFNEKVLLEAEEALYEGLVDFFEDPQKRKLLRDVRTKSREVLKLVLEQTMPEAIKEVNSFDPKKTASLLVVEILKKSTSNSQASVESTQIQEPTMKS